MGPFRRPSVLAILVVGVACAVVACDLAGEEEDLRPVLGSWRAQDLTVDGLSVKAHLDARYEQLVLTFREGASGGEFFTLLGQQEGTAEDLIVQGTFQLDDQELTLLPNEGPQVEFDNVIPDSSGTRLTLSAEEGVSEDLFLDLIRLSLQGTVDRIELRLARRSLPADVDTSVSE